MDFGRAVCVDLAELALEEEHPAEAETLARQASKEFEAEKLRDDEIWVHSILTLAFLAQGNST